MAAPKGYSRLQSALHWGAALLIVQQCLFKDAISTAWEATAKGLETAFDPLVPAHVAGRALVLIVALWRPAIRARHGSPEMTGDRAPQRALAKVTDLGLYALMILTPVSGAVAWFGGLETAAQGHELMKVALLALAALHIAGTLYHHAVLKDGLLNRMRRSAG